jgi:hypothetical protein
MCLIVVLEQFLFNICYNMHGTKNLIKYSGNKVNNSWFSSGIGIGFSIG